MQIKNKLFTIPRETIEELVKCKIFKPSLLRWYDICCYFDHIDDTTNRKIPQMDKYAITAEQFGLSEEQTRKIIARLNYYI